MFKQLCENFKDPQHVFFLENFRKLPSRSFLSLKKIFFHFTGHMDEENKNEDASKDNPHVFQVSIDFILSAIQRLFYLFNCEFDHRH